MDKVKVKEGLICFKTLSDGTNGRFDSRGKSTMYVQLEDHLGVFYSEKLTGNVAEMNKALEKFEIELVFVA
ncbi:MAG: hypothetical protein ACI35O_03945 [Bacillaceae bacterium]